MSLNVKLKQLAEMSAFIEEMASDCSRVIVTGDFNMDTMQEECPEYAQFTSSLPPGFKDAMRAASGGRVLPTTLPFEWYTKSRLAIRSTFLKRDAHDAILEAAKSEEVTFWRDQCLDYVFVSSDISVEEGSVDPMVAESKTYTQLSDHMALTLKLSMPSPASSSSSSL